MVESMWSSWEYQDLKYSHINCINLATHKTNLYFNDEIN